MGQNYSKKNKNHQSFLFLDLLNQISGVKAHFS